MSDACRSCGQEIVWALTNKGRRMPLERNDVSGAIIIEDTLEGPVARIFGSAMQVPAHERARYVSHFATCPQAKDWRGSSRAARE